MSLRIRLLLGSLLVLFSFVSNAQIEVARISIKDFKAIGFGSFLNFSVPVSEANYMTIEGGLQYFKNKDEEDVALVPVLLGYRYTLNRSGTGFYVEPNAGYCFGGTSIGVYNEFGSPVYTEDGNMVYEKVAGLMTGIGIGYLFEPGGRIQFNLGLRYEHSFAKAGANIFAFRISHAFTFGRREE